jgi:hypothetical protein
MGGGSMTKILKGPISVSFALLFTVVCFGSRANAALLLEPGVAYHNGTFDQGNGNTGKINGIGLNTRAALSLPVVFVGLDLTYLFGTSAADSGSSYDTTAVALGPVVGASLPLMPLRFWLSYYMLDYMTLKKPADLVIPAHDEISSGSAIKLGVGYTLIPLLSLNLEYTMHTFTKFENKATNTTSDLSPNAKVNEFILSATIPLDF